VKALVASLCIAIAAAAPAAGQAAPSLAVNANPVRGSSVVLTWPAGTARATLHIYSQLGTVLLAQALDPDPGRFEWDLRVAAGGDVANGAYLLVVTRADGLRLRRRLVVAR
jgi:hypothetical protein